MEGNVAELERRYQALLNDFQAGKLDQATFVAEVDRLQFIDDWGRYWMLGAQSGDWHYYDGQAWHQADPRDADKLPFMDDQGRYWQRGVKSGEWYYYDANIDEWVKPEKDDPATPTPVQGRQWQTPPLSQSYSSPTVQPVADTPPQSQFGADLFQDDEGRYWAIGAKTQQWYFYDADGWHPAHEFQVRAPAPTSSPYSYSPQAPIYQPQPSQPYPAPPSQPYNPPAYVPQPQPTYNYTIPPVENRQPPMEQPAPGQAPPPPQAPSQSGNWYYFDGNQWLKYASGEPAKETPPDPKLIIEQEAASSKQKAEVKAEAKEEKVVAEFFEEDEPPAEVVDVEVITVVEAEPDEEPQPKPTPTPSPAGQPAPPLPRRADEVRSKRSKTGSLEPATRRLDSEEAVEVPPRRRDASRPVTPMRTTTPDPGRLVTPRKKAAQEPTVIIPATSSREPSPASTTIARPSRPVPIDRRRTAREDTLPMAPVSGAKPMEPAATPPVSERHRQVTQPLPKVAPTPNPRPGTPVPQVQPMARDRVTPVVAPTTPAPTQAEPEPEGYTFGDVLRSFPSTLWTGIAGVVVMLIFAILIIIGVTYGSNFFGVDTIAAVPSPTPTLEAGLAPDSTPTPGPTTDAPNSPIITPAPASMAIFSSPELGFTLEYPENWQTDETSSIAIFSPSTQGLDLEQINDTNLRIGVVEDNASISDLLTDALAAFPADAETLNEGTISIASQTWTSTQIRFEDENLDGQGIATIAVTNKDGQGYYLIAVASAEEWNSVQPVFQGMINSFKFGAEEVVAQATAETIPQARQATPATPADEDDDDESESEEEEAGPTPTPTPRATPTPEATSTPLVYRVQPGDTLLGIAVRFGVDMDLLAQENGIANPESLQIDQELTIPFTAEELIAYNSGITGNNRTSAPATAGEEEASTNEVETTEAAGETAAAPAPQPTAQAPAREAPPAPAAPVSGRIVYPAFNPSLNSYDVWMVDLATGEQTPIAGNASQPDFNRDGTLLAYRSWERSTRGIFFRDFVGGRGGMVTRFVEDGLPSWSPDGYSFAFASRKEGDRVPRIYIGNQSGEDTFSIGFQGEYVDTFPDGRLIVKGCTPSGDCGLFIIGARGGGEKKISGEGADTAPAVSPDGSKIAFMSSGRGGNNWEIWVMNADGSNPQRLTENGNNDGLPTWSPDGQSIAYVSDQGGAWSVWVMNANGSNQRKIFGMKGSPDGKVFHDESNSKGWLEERISWAP